MHRLRNTNFKMVRGYIEGYYGKFLNWSERNIILSKLQKNKMNYYFYCPKEDVFHRFNWKKKYPKKWLHEFKKFCETAKKKKIKIISGIAPGLDFNFLSEFETNKDVNFLIQKINKLLENGSDFVAIQFDDIPEDFQKKYKGLSEGKLHATLCNFISEKLKISLFLVPRVYSDELLSTDKFYLDELIDNLNSYTYIFYCGRNIVSKSFKSSNKKILKLIKSGKIINWDNFYANDYCPKKIFLGPWTNVHNLNKVMINGTGMVTTDCLILDIVKNCMYSSNKKKAWEKSLMANNVHNDFLKIAMFFYSPVTNNDKKIIPIKYKKEIIHILDQLLWEWKTELSREWYPYLLMLKQDVQIFSNDLSFKRILKTQTHPIQKILLKENL